MDDPSDKKITGFFLLAEGRARGGGWGLCTRIIRLFGFSVHQSGV